MDHSPVPDLMCDFDDSMRCSRCGYQAKRLPTFRVCRTIPELAHKIATDAASRRVVVPPLRIGTAVAGALSAVGVTQERVKKWIKKDCGCEQRKAFLNSVGETVSAVVERCLNGALGLVLPNPVTADDVAAVANSLARSELTNKGLKAQWSNRPDGPPSA